jgi:hypothetical protein
VKRIWRAASLGDSAQKLGATLIFGVAIAIVWTGPGHNNMARRGAQPVELGLVGFGGIVWLYGTWRAWKEWQLIDKLNS